MGCPPSSRRRRTGGTVQCNGMHNGTGTGVTTMGTTGGGPSVGATEHARIASRCWSGCGRWLVIEHPSPAEACPWPSSPCDTTDHEETYAAQHTAVSTCDSFI